MENINTNAITYNSHGHRRKQYILTILPSLIETLIFVWKFTGDQIT